MSEESSNSVPRLTAAREAFRSGDAAASRAVHGGAKDSTPRPAAMATEGGHVSGDGTAPSTLFYAALDGGATSLALLACVVGGVLPSLTLESLVGVLAVLSLARAARDALVVSNATRVYTHERKREVWELANYPDGEVAEMIELYVSKGASVEAATKAITALAAHSELFVDIMMAEELRLRAPDCSPLLAAVMAGVGFLCGSIVPLGSLQLVNAALLLATQGGSGAAAAAAGGVVGGPWAPVALAAALCLAAVALEAARHRLLPLQASLSVTAGAAARNAAAMAAVLAVAPLALVAAARAAPQLAAFLARHSAV